MRRSNWIKVYQEKFEKCEGEKMNSIEVNTFIGITTGELLIMWKDHGLEVSWVFDPEGNLCCVVRMNHLTFGQLTYRHTWSSTDFHYCQDLVLMSRVFVEQAYAEIENKNTYNRQRKILLDARDESNKKYR